MGIALFLNLAETSVIVNNDINKILFIEPCRRSMARRVVEKIVERTGAKLVNKDLLLGDIRRMTFEQDVDYNDIAETAAKVDVEMGSEVSVWALGTSVGGHPQVAYQRFTSIDASSLREEVEENNRLLVPGDDEGSPDKGYISMEE